MVYLKDWEDFEIAAESMFMQSPENCRFTLKYIHSKGLIQLKFTDNVKVSRASDWFPPAKLIHLISSAVHPIQNRDYAGFEEDRKIDW